MFRSLSFWLVVTLIVAGIALTATLGVLHWLVATLAVAALALDIVLLVAAYAVGRAESPELPLLQEVPDSRRMPVVLDCDLALGYPFRDVSDGLALLYLLGEPRVDLLCISTTSGNASVRATTRTVRRLLDSLNCNGITTLRGAAGPDDEPQANQAARRLITMAQERPGEITLIATGSMTNLKHAAQLDPMFFARLQGVYIMGGVTGPLMWNGRSLAELNFSLDPEAAYRAIHADCPVTIATGQAGLTAVFRAPQFAALQTLGDPVARLIVRETRLWFALTRLCFRDGGFAMWASTAALMLTQPGLFEYERVHITSTTEDLRTGLLYADPDARGPVRLVRGVCDFERFILAHLAAWHRLGQQVEARKGT